MPFIVNVKKRPGVDFFINEMSKYYELVIYTASLAEVYIFLFLFKYINFTLLK